MTYFQLENNCPIPFAIKGHYSTCPLSFRWPRCLYAFDCLPVWIQCDHFGIYWKTSGNMLSSMGQNPDNFAEKQKIRRHLYLKVAHCRALCGSCGTGTASKGNWEGAKWRHLIFSLFLFTASVLMMVEKEGKQQLLGDCFRKGRITGYLEGGLKTEAHGILSVVVKMLRDRAVIHHCFIYNLSILSLFIYIDLHIPCKCQWLLD